MLPSAPPRIAPSAIRSARFGSRVIHTATATAIAPVIATSAQRIVLLSACSSPSEMP